MISDQILACIIQTNITNNIVPLLGGMAHRLEEEEEEEEEEEGALLCRAFGSGSLLSRTAEQVCVHCCSHVFYLMIHCVCVVGREYAMQPFVWEVRLTLHHGVTCVSTRHSVCLVWVARLSTSCRTIRFVVGHAMTSFTGRSKRGWSA